MADTDAQTGAVDDLAERVNDLIDQQEEVGRIGAQAASTMRAVVGAVAGTLVLVAVAVPFLVPVLHGDCPPSEIIIPVSTSEVQG